MAVSGMTARGPLSADRDGVADAPLTIGELAARTGVTAETIRYYEREGVIPPAERRGSGQYRRYAAADVERLRFVRRARDLGFSLDEVRELLDLATGERERPCAEVRQMAQLHLAEVDAKLAQLAELRGQLARLVEGCTRDGTAPDCALLQVLGARPSGHG